MSHLDKIHDFLGERGLSYLDPMAESLARSELGATDAEIGEYFGHGPLWPWLNDPKVTEILVNGPAEIWIERSGSLLRANAAFTGEDSLKRYVRRILSAQSRKVDPRDPFADIVIEEGIRFHVAVPPVCKKGVCLSIRKPPREPWSLADLEAAGAMSGGERSLLQLHVAERKNIFVSGGTSSGKTSMLSALLACVSEKERILALEDIAELRVRHPHFLSLEARPANQEGEGGIHLARLLREALRMRPDRIVIGECRGAEAMDLLLALNSGHHGSMGTIHANSPRDALHRLETLALLAAGNLGERAIRGLVLSAVNIVVHLERSSGVRKISSIAEVKGWDGGNFLLRELKPS